MSEKKTIFKNNKKNRFLGLQDKLDEWFYRVSNGRTGKILSYIIIILTTWLIISTIHSHQYDNKTNNCLHQSNAIVKWCTEHWIPATVVSGDHKDKGGNSTEAHAWVRFFGFLDFESTCWFPLFNSLWWNVYNIQEYNITSHQFQDI